MLSLLLALAVGATPAGAALGTYRVRADTRLTGVPLVSTLELRGDAVLRAGDGPRGVRARLASRGQACELAGTLAPDGKLAFAGGQRCRIRLDDPGVRGEVLATLRSGQGRVEGDRLVLALELGVAGKVRVAAGGLAGLPGLGSEAVMPVDGAASVRAEGSRDHSRGADP